MIYSAPLGKFIVKADKCIIFYDTIVKKEVARIETGKTIKSVKWKNYYTYCAILFKKSFNFYTFF